MKYANHALFPSCHRLDCSKIFGRCTKTNVFFFSFLCGVSMYMRMDLLRWINFHRAHRLRKGLKFCISFSLILFLFLFLFFSFDVCLFLIWKQFLCSYFDWSRSLLIEKYVDLVCWFAEFFHMKIFHVSMRFSSTFDKWWIYTVLFF